MANLPGVRTDLPMMPLPVYAPNNAFMPAAVPENLHINKVPVPPAGRVLHAGPMATPPEPGSHVTSAVPITPIKPGGDQAIGDTASEDPSRLKFWNTDETMELIELYKKYLPEFHKFGQKKMNVWQRVTEEMVAKGYTNFSWAECSNKFRSLRDSYRRTTTAGRAQTWQYYAVMKDVMKMEKTILETELPTPRPIKGTITCQTPEVRPPLQQQQHLINPPGLATTTTTAMITPGMTNTALLPTLTPHQQQQQQQPTTSRSEDGEGGDNVGGEPTDDPTRKRLLSTELNSNLNLTNGSAAKKRKDNDQDGGEITIGRNFNGDPVRARTKKAGGGAGPMGTLTSLQALGKSLCLPQSQLVVGDDGQIVQTTSAPTGLFVSDQGHLCHNSPATPATAAGAGRQPGGSMPQWFKMYEKRTRAESGRRLEELKEMHRESLDLQRQTLEVARHKNELLKNLTESLAEFKALLHR